MKIFNKLFAWIHAHPVIGNPLLVAFYGAVMYLTTNETQLGHVSTWVRAGFIFGFSILSAIKNALEVSLKKKSISSDSIS